MCLDYSIINSNELLARFIFYKNRIRNDNTIKPDAFIPYPNNELSVTRHLTLTHLQLSTIGESIATLRSLTLYGRADIKVCDVETLPLHVQPDPLIPDNPNHAKIIGWPATKSEQKSLALEIAAKAVFISR